MKWFALASLSIIILLTGCSISTSSANPKWVDKLIVNFQSDPVGNPPQSIWRYEYKDQTVYFVPAQCCDQYSKLYNASGDLVCAPDGGFIGKGDGRCPDFFSLRKNEKLIWQDSRTR
jgi:hypothetical protein